MSQRIKPRGHLDVRQYEPKGRVPARSQSDVYAAKPDTSTVMHPSMIAEAGGGEPHTNVQPYLTVNFCIAMVGIFPARD